MKLLNLFKKGEFERIPKAKEVKETLAEKMQSAEKTKQTELIRQPAKDHSLSR